MEISPEYNEKIKSKYNAKCLIYSENNISNVIQEANSLVEEYTGGHITNAVSEDKLKCYNN